MPTQVTDSISNIHIALPGSPLKWLTCYVIKGGEGARNLVLDTGFNRPECTEALMKGLDTLDIRPEDTDVFLTHMHSDHVGNAGTLYKMGFHMYMSKTDYDRTCVAGDKLAGTFDFVIEQGMPEDEYREVSKYNPAVLFKSEYFDYTPVSDGDVLVYGDHELECVYTPGHTPGHMCLYERKRKIMFLGDHVLFDITPNICAWPGEADSLGTYLDNLRRIAAYDVELALPAHRTDRGMTMYERIDQLIRHHEFRLGEARKVVEENGEVTPYDAAARMTWRIKAKNWDDFPLSQKIFALGESQAHLDYLSARGEIIQGTYPNGVIYYKSNG